LYPNENLCGFYPSVRFELNREAYEDYEYLATLVELSKTHPLTAQQRQLVRDLENTIVPLPAALLVAGRQRPGCLLGRGRVRGTLPE